MRTNEERAEAVRRRAGQLRAERRQRIFRVSGAAFAAASIAIIVTISTFMPQLTVNIASAGDTGMRASIFSDSGALGYVVVGLVAFILGISFTVFCTKLRKWRDDEKDLKREERDDRDDR